jgi:MFS transporter, BCD family, chlorophyll transporter
MFYLSLSMIFAFSQDLVLEPFAADIFGTSAAATTRFSAYWGGASILGTVMFLVMARRYRFLTNTVMSYAGVIVLFFTFMLFAYSALGHVEAVIIPGLILLGLGLGFWNVGTLGLMMDMSPASRAGTFLGFWTLVVTLSRGLGVSGGGIMRDIVLQVSGDLTLSYGMVFVVGVVGLGVSLWTLSQVNVLAFRDDIAEPADAEAVFVAAMD